MGDLCYLEDCTTQDLCYSVGKLCAANHSPTRRHFALLNATIRYLLHIRQYGLKYLSKHTKTGTGIEEFSDSDFSGRSKIHNRAAYPFHYQSISWRSSKQSMFSMSTVEVEYIAMAKTMQASKIVIKLVGEFNIQSKSNTIPTGVTRKQPST